MQAASIAKSEAIALRKEGKSYSEILSVVPVAKSTLSLWLKGVCLSKSQTHELSERKRMAQLRGAATRKRQRQDEERTLASVGMRDVGSISERELMLIGATLYWAEGSKAKPHNVSQGLDFGNTDPNMARLYVAWLVQVLQVGVSDICYALYIHDTQAAVVDKHIAYWRTVLGVPVTVPIAIVYKRHQVNSYRRNKGENYHGLIRIKARRSSGLYRHVAGWILGIAQNYGTVQDIAGSSKGRTADFGSAYLGSTPSPAAAHQSVHGKPRT